MNKIDELCINTIRILSAEAVQKANSGHPGLPMGSAAIAYTIWEKQMKHNPVNPKWADRDRFILSAGHGSMLLYSLLYMFGYGLTLEDLQNFRQWGSKTPGHPEYGHTPGVETTTGPLGQGVANGVGMAMAEAHLAAKFNRPGYSIVDHYTYVLCGDGDMMEGVASEAASLAGTLGLGKLIVLYDSNNITIEGSTDIAFREDTAKRFEAYGWHVQKVEDGNDVDAINNAIKKGKEEKGKPSLIVVKTCIGYGCPPKQGKASVHGEPLGAENIKLTKEFLKWESEEEFHMPEAVLAQMEYFKNKGAAYEAKWVETWTAYEKEYSELAKEWKQWHSGEVSEKLFDSEDFWSFEDKPIATRITSETVLNRAAKLVPNLIGGSADLAPSNKTIMRGRGDFSASDYSGANLHFGVREHAMGAISNGIAVHGGLKVYNSTFFVFSDYMKPAIRLSALMKLPVVYILTHDSIGVGEDGPTHQPVEHISALRGMPNLTVFRPADGRETSAAWYAALTSSSRPTALVLTRQNLPQLSGTGRDALKGAYALWDSGKETPDVILMASGSEVRLVYEAGKKLAEKGFAARVISMPSWELFNDQPESYRKNLLPDSVRARVAVEAGVSMGWHRYTGIDGEVISIESFGASAPAEKLFKEFGFTVDNVVETALKLAGKGK